MMRHGPMLPCGASHRRTPRTFRLLGLGLAATCALGTTSRGQAASDTTGIRAAAMNYIEGWYAGDGDRMAKALHPELAKRMVRTDSTGRSQLSAMSAMTLIDGTRRGGGTHTPTDRRREDFRILDIYHGAAVAKIVASDWIDYLQLAKWNGEWKIVNVLWELTPKGEHATL
jgi:hypothetical protein